MRRSRLAVAFVALGLAWACSDDHGPPTAPAVPKEASPVIVADLAGNPYEQCRNGDNGDQPCNYVNGSINAGNSFYAEGRVVPIKLGFKNLAASSDGKYSVTITFEHFKSSSNAYAYDFPATYFASVPDAQSNPCVSGTISELCPLNPAAAVTAAFDMSQVGGERAAALATYLATGKTALLYAWGVTAVTITPVQALDAQTSQFVITFTVDQSKPQGQRDVQLAWGGHLARDQDYAGADNGAHDISGAPFHWGLEADGSKDLPLQPGAVEEPLVPKAKIALTPLTAVNTVGEAHTVTVTVSEAPDVAQAYVAAAGEHVDFTLTGTNGASPVLDAAASTCDNAGANTDANGQCTIVFTSASAGTVTISASSNVAVGGTTIAVSTDGSGDNSTTATKTFVDGFITITPNTATNGVNQAHTFTAVATAIPNGVTPVTIADIAITVSPAPSTPGTVSCAAQSGNSKTCTLQINSSSTGTFTANASAQITIGSEVFTRATNGTAGPGGSGPATKTYVAGQLTWLKVDGGNNNAALGGATFEVCLVGSPPCHSVSDDVDGTDGPAGAWLDQDGRAGYFKLTNLDLGTYSVTETAPPAGYNIITSGQQATLSQSNLSASIANAFDNRAPNAFMVISPNTATNGITQAHTFTAVLTAIPNGGSPVTIPDFAITVSPTPSTLGTVSCAAQVGNSKTCTLEINSSSAGTFTANASGSVTVGLVTLNRDTDPATTTIPAGPGGSGAATKIYVAGSLRWLKSDGTNDLPGATFSVCPPNNGACFTVTDNTGISGQSTPDADADGGQFQLNNLVLGQWTITETSPPPGYIGSNAPITVTLTTSSPDGATATAPPTIVNSPSTRGQLVPTQTTCPQFAAGTASDLEPVTYNVKGGKINNVSPGVFFYYATILGSGTVTVTQTINPNILPPFAAQGQTPQAYLYNADCSNPRTMTAGANGSFSITLPANGSYIIGIKYEANSIVGSNAPPPNQAVRYTFSTLLNGTLFNSDFFDLTSK